MWAGLELWVFGSSESTKFEEEEGEEMEEDSKRGQQRPKGRVCVWVTVWALSGGIFGLWEILEKLFCLLCYVICSVPLFEAKIGSSRWDFWVGFC